MGKRRTITIDDLDTQKAIALYQNGATLKAAAEAVFMSREGLKYRFKVLGIEIDGECKGRALSPATIEKLRRERQAGKPYTQIARECKVSVDSVSKYTGDIELGFSTQGRCIILPDDPRIIKAAELYKNGATFENVAYEVGISESTIRHRLKDMGIPAREPGRKRVNPEQIEKIHREHQNGKSFYRIAKEMGITPPTVRKYIKQAGKQKDGEQD